MEPQPPSQLSDDYKRIETAIAYIRAHYRERPPLDVLAAQAGLSPGHFQRIFTRWAGVSPKKFMEYISLEHAREILLRTRASLCETAWEAGLSGSGRLHDLFIRIEAMTPDQYRSGGRGVEIRYDFHPTPLGEALIASSDRGVCFLAFSDDREATLEDFRQRFPAAQCRQESDPLQRQALAFFSGNDQTAPTIRLHLKGTPFQMKVWEALLKIPEGALVTYGDIAAGIGNPSACRAVGTAVGDNPVSVLIPCHRVIRTSGQMGGYHWGLDRKAALIGREAVATDSGVEEASPATL